MFAEWRWPTGALAGRMTADALARQMFHRRVIAEDNEGLAKQFDDVEDIGVSLLAELQSAVSTTCSRQDLGTFTYSKQLRCASRMEICAIVRVPSCLVGL
jgi:hypothetical protein